MVLYLERDKEKEVIDSLNRGKIVIIQGPRQSGKTTLMKFIHKSIGGTYFDLTDAEIKELIERDVRVLLDYEQPIFLDEVGEVKNIGKKIKYLYDNYGIKLVISGSGAYELKENIGGELVGRATYVEMFPLSFQEFVRWKRKDFYVIYLKEKTKLWDSINKGKKYIAKEYTFLKNLFEEYERFGGYPRVVLSNKKLEELKDIVDLQIERDVFRHFDIRDKESIKEFVRELSYNTANLLSFSSFNLNYEKIIRYLNILKSEFIVELLPPFYNNPKTEIKKRKKLFFLDNGYANFLSGNRLSLGQIRENAIFIQLMHKFGINNLRYWMSKSKGEVDFVVLGKEKIAFECKINKPVGRSFWSFIEKYSVNKAIIIRDKPGFETRGKSKIYHVPPYWI